MINPKWDRALYALIAVVVLVLAVVAFASVRKEADKPDGTAARPFTPRIELATVTRLVCVNEQRSFDSGVVRDVQLTESGASYRVTLLSGEEVVVFPQDGVTCRILRGPQHG